MYYSHSHVLRFVVKNRSYSLTLLYISNPKISNKNNHLVSFYNSNQHTESPEEILIQTVQHTNHIKYAYNFNLETFV